MVQSCALAAVSTAMSTPTTSSSHCTNVPICLPCQFPNYKWWFGNKSGLTQHINQFHLDFLVFKPTFIPPSSLNSTQQDNNPNSSAKPDPAHKSVHPHTGVEGKDVYFWWHRCSGKLYHNLHPKLTGIFANFKQELSDPLICYTQHCHVIPPVHFYLQAALLSIILRRHQMTGFPSMTMLNLSSQIFFTHKFRSPTAI